MKTEDLLKVLAEDTLPRPGAGQILARWIGPSLVVAFLALIATLGLREGLFDALVQPLVGLKLVLPLVLAAAALPLALQLARPGARPRSHWLWIAPLVALLAAGYAWVITPDGARMMAFTGKTIAGCLVSIPLLSLPILGVMLLALRQGAVVAPVRAGAVAGLAAGGLGAAIYALHCIEDSPMFYATWYSLGIVIVATLGAALGPRLLRW
jgi:hypothetical protein